MAPHTQMNSSSETYSRIGAETGMDNLASLGISLGGVPSQVIGGTGLNGMGSIRGMVGVTNNSQNYSSQTSPQFTHHPFQSQAQQSKQSPPLSHHQQHLQQHHPQLPQSSQSKVKQLTIPPAHLSSKSSQPHSGSPRTSFSSSGLQGPTIPFSSLSENSAAYPAFSLASQPPVIPPRDHVLSNIVTIAYDFEGRPRPPLEISSSVNSSDVYFILKQKLVADGLLDAQDTLSLRVVLGSDVFTVDVEKPYPADMVGIFNPYARLQCSRFTPNPPLLSSVSSTPAIPRIPPSMRNGRVSSPCSSSSQS